MNLQAFIATRRDCADLGPITGLFFTEADGKIPCLAAGYVYDGDTFIIRNDDGTLTLTIYNEGWTVPADRIAELELRLYDWIAGEFADEDTYTDAAAAELAVRFADMLRAYMGPAKWDAMRAANAAETNPDVCHSHDYLDANQIMIEAFEAIYRREPASMDDVDADAARSGDPDELEAQREAEDDAELITAAWNLARPLLGR